MLSFPIFSYACLKVLNLNFCYCLLFIPCDAHLNILSIPFTQVKIISSSIKIVEVCFQVLCIKLLFCVCCSIKETKSIALTANLIVKVWLRSNQLTSGTQVYSFIRGEPSFPPYKNEEIVRT